MKVSKMIPLLAATLSVLLLTMTAKWALASCVIGEYVLMNDPVVTVIEGPGDPVSEQARWENLNYHELEGSLEIFLGETWFYLERIQ